jgi:hypothetical protein
MLAGIAAVGSAGAAAAAAPSSTDGYVRLAHLSPDTGDVDVYLDALSLTMKEQVFPGVGYGTVSAYLTLPAGTYAVAMRNSGAASSTPAVLTKTVTVLAGHAYTVAGVGRHADLGLRVIDDDLSSPLNGQAMVRIVQASIRAPLLDVSIKGGATIATNVQFATTTTYRSVPPGILTLEVGPTGGTPVPLQVTLQADSVYSVLVLDGKNGLTAQLRTDAVSKGAPPQGGVATGGGGMTRGHLFMPTVYVAAGALVLMLLIVFRRGGTDRWTTRRLSRHPRRLPSRSL